MWRVEPHPTRLFPDTERCLRLLEAYASFFEAHAPVHVARAPGRLDVMGGIADYSGSLVLELPLACATLVAVQHMEQPVVTVQSTTGADVVGNAVVTVPLALLMPSHAPLDYAVAHTYLTSNPDTVWAAYVLGVLVVLQREYNVRFERGIRILIDCDVPIGKGVSSSAALEVATMQALCAICSLNMDGRTMAILCQKVENLIVGAPCGIMDQMTVACGEENALLALLCQPAELQPPVPLPADVTVWGLDSNIRHAVTGADYGAVRIGAFMGYRIIAEQMGLPVRQKSHELVEIDDAVWHGYLANMTPTVWETTCRSHVPVEMDGTTFLTKYGGFTDTVTHIDPRRTYAIRQPTAHPIYEHHRVQRFRTLLQVPIREECLIELGALMYQSHASYSACGLGSEGTDRLVELVREAGPAAHVYGAKITGGGSGGTVAILARRGADETIARIAAQYADEIHHPVTVLHGSSPGAIASGTLMFVP